MQIVVFWFCRLCLPVSVSQEYLSLQRYWPPAGTCSPTGPSFAWRFDPPPLGAQWWHSSSLCGAWMHRHSPTVRTVVPLSTPLQIQDKWENGVIDHYRKTGTPTRWQYVYVYVYVWSKRRSCHNISSQTPNIKMPQHAGDWFQTNLIQFISHQYISYTKLLSRHHRNLMISASK